MKDINHSHLFDFETLELYNISAVYRKYLNLKNKK